MTPRTPAEILRELRELAATAEDALDNDTYEQFKRADFDSHDDDEIVVRVGTARKLFMVLAEIDRITESQP